MLLVNDLSTFSFKSIQVLVMVLKVYLKILLIALFYATETCVLINNNLSVKLFSSFKSPVVFEEIFKIP